jgi:rhodanese-related sulfurtransferase
VRDQVVTRAQLKALLANSSSDAVLLDLRSVGECKVEPGIPGATNIPGTPIPTCPRSGSDGNF